MTGETPCTAARTLTGTVGGRIAKESAGSRISRAIGLSTGLYESCGFNLTGQALDGEVSVCARAPLMAA